MVDHLQTVRHFKRQHSAFGRCVALKFAVISGYLVRIVLLGYVPTYIHPRSTLELLSANCRTQPGKLVIAINSKQAMVHSSALFCGR